MDLRSYAQTEKRFLVGLFAISLLVRMALFGWYMRHDEHYMLAFDSEQYQEIAVKITQGKGITTKEGSPNLYRLPGYPLFLAACYKIFNVPGKASAKSDSSTQAALLIQIILASLIPVLIFFFALTLFPRQLMVAKVAAIAAALHAGFIIYAGILSTESLFLFFFLLFLICFYSQRLLFCAGIFLGIASLIRPVGHYVLVVAIFMMLALALISMFRKLHSNGARPEEPAGRLEGFVRPNGSRHSSLCSSLLTTSAIKNPLIQSNENPSALPVRRSLVEGRIRCGFMLRKSVTLFLGWLTIVSSWLLRNYLLTGALFFHTLPGLHFLQYSATAVEQDRLGIDYFQAKNIVFALWDDAVAQQEKLLHRSVTEYERFAIAEHVAFRHLLAHPLRALKHACIQIARTCGTLYSSILLYVPLGTVYGDQASLWFKIKLYLFPRAMDPWLVPLIYWEMISYLFILLGCALFFLQVVYDKSLRLVFLQTVLFASLLLIITLAYGCARLRFAVEPFMIVWMAYAWMKLISHFSQQPVSC